MNNTDKDNKITVYHVDTVKRNNDFVDGEFYSSEEDGFWCGKGMYFWDNIANAKYWLKNRNKKNHDEQFNISKASIIFNDDELLDMTDYDTRLSILKYLKKYKESFSIKELKQTGLIINFIYDRLDKNNKNVFNLVKAHGIYNRNKNDLPSFSKDNFSGPHVTGRIKTIYAIRDKNVIINRTIL